MQERQEMWVQSLGREDPLEEEVATHPSILVWRIPWAEEPGELQSVESQSQTQLSDWEHRHAWNALSSFLPLFFLLFMCLEGSLSHLLHVTILAMLCIH